MELTKGSGEQRAKKGVLYECPKVSELPLGHPADPVFCF